MKKCRNCGVVENIDRPMWDKPHLFGLCADCVRIAIKAFVTGAATGAGVWLGTYLFS